MAGMNPESSNNNQNKSNIVDDSSKLLEKEMIQMIANNSNAFFKHQQLKDDDLTLPEKQTIVEDLLKSDKSLFLHRYGRFLDAKQLEYFQQNEPTEEVKVQLNYLSLQMSSNKNKLLRNRRYQALQELLEDSTYFSDNEMQSRNPLLFEQMIGKYMNEQEKKDLDNSSYLNNYDRIGFSSFLFERIRHANMERKLDEQEQQLQDEENDASRDSQENVNISNEEKEMLREEFKDIMIQNFLNGNDEDFDYTRVDNNEDYDLNKEFERDQEEKYFDSDLL